MNSLLVTLSTISYLFSIDASGFRDAEATCLYTVHGDHISCRRGVRIPLLFSGNRYSLRESRRCGAAVNKTAEDNLGTLSDTLPEPTFEDIVIFPKIG
jgi:hypothetical protein